MKEADESLIVPGDDDENVGNQPIKKKEKRRKSKEERALERKVIWWTWLIILIITLGFWLVPNLKNFKWEMPSIKVGESKSQESKPKTELKNYIEYKL